ncbi:MAG: ester cyclase [Thermomicrobiales bacterium]
MHKPLIPSRSGLTRRAALTGLGAGGLGAALAARGLAAAQEATPEAAADLPPVMQEYIAAWDALDADRLAATYAEDAVSENMATGFVLEGREAIRAYYTALFAGFEDLSVPTTNAFATGGWAAAEWTFSGRHTGQVPGWPPPSGNPVTLRGVGILALADGQIRGGRDYFDAYGLLVQLGVVPPPAAPAATPPA